ncbi:AAA ATPase [Terramyces sp. JEL0728]|nr:AAA ATPase [Terramyces sp. JEL0728]
MKTRSGKRVLEELPLSKLDANQSTPKKVKLTTDQFTPTKRELKDQNVTPKRTPLKILQEAKAAFRRCATPKKLIGRENERQKLNDFIDRHVVGEQSGSLYISGCPGTGKTALLNEILLDRQKSFQNLSFTVKYAFINCMNITEAKNIFANLADTWKLSGTGSTMKDLVKDHEPEYLSFNPYQIKEIAAIIKDRLMTLDDPEEPASPIKPAMKAELPIMQPMAVELAARKLAGTGDLRKALDVCRMAIQMVENEEKSLETLTTIPKVTVKHVLSAASSMLGAQSNSRMDKLQTQAKFVLTTIYLMIKTKQKDLTIRKVFGFNLGRRKLQSNL